MSSGWTRAVLGAFLVLAVTLAGLLGCAGRTDVQDGAAGSDDIGRFVWRDLLTDDEARARTFYGQLLGWTFEDATRNGEPYVLVRDRGTVVAGIVSVDSGDSDESVSQWLSYVLVADADASSRRVEALGGDTLAGPVTVGSYGRAAVVTDPQGALLGLVALSTPASAEPSLPPMGSFFWHEYLAEDEGAALTFYEELLGYEGEASDSAGGVDYHVLRRGRSRAGLVELAEQSVRPNWLPYVRVADPQALADRAESLGGEVLLEPRPEVRGGTLAIVADPTGAALALQKWPLEES